VRRIAVIFNPAARGDRAKRLRARIEGLGEGVVLQATSCGGEAESLARAAVADGFDTVVAAGGDGTVNEVVNGIAGTDAALGLLPLGTMNVFATELGLPVSDLEACWEIVQGEQIRASIYRARTANTSCNWQALASTRRWCRRPARRSNAASARSATL
jgi:diacylglycerol kinase family enzyme